MHHSKSFIAALLFLCTFFVSTNADGQTYFPISTIIDAHNSVHPNDGTENDAIVGFTGQDTNNNFIGPTSPTVQIVSSGSINDNLYTFNSSTVIV